MIKRENSKLIEDFVYECTCQGLSAGRIAKYRQQLLYLASLSPVAFTSATRDDVKRIIAHIEQSSYAPWTKHDYKVSMKHFFKWLKQTEDGYPIEVSWIKTTVKAHKTTLPEDILTEKEAKQLIENGKHPRDRALISLLYESGCRIGELLSMRIKSVSFNEPTCSVILHGKTGSRRILLVDSTPFLATWIHMHPARADPNASLWISIGTKNHHQCISYNTARDILVETAARAKICKRVNPHNFRHSRATHLANKLTEAQMKEYFGWTQSSEMASIYVHLSGRDVDQAILAIHGLAKPESTKTATETQPRTCPRCTETNEFQSKLCKRCGQPLDLVSAIEKDSQYTELTKLVDSPEALKRLIAQMIAKHVKSK